ncbi:helix-turn-helix transcriptional regulator [Limosilactobacillus fermentum]
MTQRQFYNPELDQTGLYTEVWQTERIQVKDIQDLVVTKHYWQDAAGELWADFDDPMENVHRSFDTYRKRKGYLTPNQIRQLREDLHLTVRQMATALGIAPSSLTQIENNQRIQAPYQEKIFLAARDAYQATGQLPPSWQSQQLN